MASDNMAGENDDVSLLRDILARELETINNYQSLSRQATDPQIAAFIQHITDEEKEHVAEAMQLINRLDQKQAALFGNESHWKSGGDNDERTFTVGSLRNRSRE